MLLGDIFLVIYDETISSRINRILVVIRLIREYIFVVNFIKDTNANTIY
jgi:hypothetical protein